MKEGVTAALIAFGSFTTGMGIVAAVLYAKSLALVKGTRYESAYRKNRWLAVTKVGIVVTQLVLLQRIISTLDGAFGSTTPPPPALPSFLYLLGLALTGVGIIGSCAVLIRELPELETLVAEEAETLDQRRARGGRETSEEHHRREATQEVADQAEARVRAYAHEDRESARWDEESTKGGE